MTSPELSVVIPCYFTASRVGELCERLTTALKGLDYEVLLVNDGSRDETWDEIVKASSKPRIHGLDLAKNFGQHNALLAGISEAKGRYIVTMDDDMQHDPGDIIKLLAKVQEENLDVLYAIPRHEQHGFVRDFLSIRTKQLFEYLLDVAHATKTSAYRIFSAELVPVFTNYTGRHVDIDALLLWGTDRVGTLEVDHHPRLDGESNYRLFGLLSYAVKLIVSNSTVPLKLVGYLGLLLTLFGIGTMVYVLVAYFTRDSLPGFTFTVSIVVMFSGAIMFSLGVVGQYLAHMYYRQMGYPYAVVRRRIGGKEELDVE